MTNPPMATPRIAAGVLIRDPDGRVLLVKPTYKEGWDLPGGYVEPGESPKRAAAREVLEELQLELAVSHLLAVDWAPSESEGDKLLFVFDGGVVDVAAESLHVGDDEVERIAFWSVDSLADALPERLIRRVNAVLGGHGIYLEHGQIA